MPLFRAPGVPLPKSTTTSGVLAKAESGKCIPATGDVTINNNVFEAGDAVSIDNTTAGNISIVQGTGVTLELAGSATTGTRTLATKGLATVWFRDASTGVCIGQGLT